MLLSVCVYTSLAAILFALGWHVWKREERLKAATGRVLPFWSWEIIASILIFAVVAGARYHTGFDHAMYLHQYVSYQKYGFFTRDFEPLFMWVTQLMAGAHVHYFFYFAFWAALEIAVLYYALNQHKCLIPWVALLIVLGPTFVHLMNTMRQGVVECAVPLLLTYKCNKKKLQMFTIICILSLIHYVAFVLMALFVLRNDLPGSGKNLQRIRVVLIALFVLAIIFGVYPIWLEAFVELIKEIPSFAIGQYQEILSFKSEFHLPVGPLTLLNILISGMVVWFLPELVHKMGWSHVISFNAYTSLIYILPYYMFSNTNCYFMRPFEVFNICFIVTLAATVFWLFKESRTRTASVLIVASCTYIYLALFKVFLRPEAVNLPYLYNTFIGR